ncbi:PD-(D/E)XK nuclease superfamily protein [Candidatus Brocadiaceae bacterium B188]|nr:CRISPR-associated protein Cas4 [Candidatus Brocadia sapporoensis]QQR67685.1 MAG: CRISPR-associated protein Cas4 [Candidatus Brocadia sp.]RZV59076.1 MAG: CRISPR-associated protein Cas4 [Candidatus Brocadia sp. BROELEC01]TWU52515.1 PD-(D/E)XK nuclease superfamily protein [Candidatus Brocadiaceae bacterium B188]
MNYSEDDLIQLSSLQHFVFCERQCALIHIEQSWSENLFTAEGRIMHDKVDTANREVRGKVRIDYGVPLRSLKLGLIGKADVVEFHKTDDGKWMPFPVEYKRGKSKMDNCDRVQLCAQAICLEEMLNVAIGEGALFYGQTRRREDVVFDKALRTETENAARRVHELIGSGITPKAEYSKKCKLCSLLSICLPKVNSKASDYLMRAMEE